MANEPKKCAHEGCSCTVSGDGKYCSASCEDAAGTGTQTLGCDCPHSGCKGHL